MNKKVKFLGDIEVNNSLALGETTLTETELKALKSGTSNVEDITYVGVGESITFGSASTLPNGFITRIGGNSSEYGEVEEDLINVANYKHDDNDYSYMYASWDDDGNITLPSFGANVGCILYKGTTILSKDATFISFVSDQNPSDGYYPTYCISTNNGDIEVTAGATHSFSAGTIITKIGISCYTDMVTWDIDKPKFMISVDKNLISINKEGTTNIVTLEEGIGSIVPQYEGALTKTPTSIRFDGWGLAAEFNGQYTMVNNKIMEADGEIYVIESYQNYSSGTIDFMKNGVSHNYSTELIDDFDYGYKVLKYSIPVMAGDFVSITLSVNGSVCGYDGYVTYEVYTNLGTQNFALPEIPKLSLGIDNRYYNYIDFENNFAGILVDVVEFDGSEDEDWEFYRSSIGNYSAARNQNFVKPIKYNDISKSRYIELAMSLTDGDPTCNIFSFAEGYLQIGAQLISASHLTTEEQWRTWLSQNPLKLLYVLPPEQRKTIPLENVEPLAITLGASNTLKFANCSAVCTVKYQEKG